MSGSIKFRKLCCIDTDQLGNLLESNNRPEITTFFYPFPMSKTTAKKILDPLSKDLFFAILLNDKFIGMSMLRGFDEGYDIPSFGIFIDFFYCGKGYGQKLTQWTMDWANQHQIKNIRLAVHETNKVALKLYQSLGFIKTQDYKDKFGRTCFVMNKSFNII